MLSGFDIRECRMNVGKTLFAQVMEFVPWKTFGRIIERHKGDGCVRTLGCADLFRIMAFSQLTWRESLRDIEVCLEANQSKLFQMGIAAPPPRFTLSDALNLRDWRIYHALALRLISHARALYAEDPSVLGLDASVYALDSTTIDLCLSLFDWAPFRSTKAAIKLHTLLDLRGAIPTFIHISDGQDARCQRAGHSSCRGGQLLHHGSRISGLRATVRSTSGRRLLRHTRQAEHGWAPRLFLPC
jgi:hypothetical protein